MALYLLTGLDDPARWSVPLNQWPRARTVLPISLPAMIFVGAILGNGRYPEDSRFRVPTTFNSDILPAAETAGYPRRGFL